MTLASSGANQKPALDESSFQQLLSAAYVVQQHNDSLWARVPQLDTARLLADISQMQAKAGGLELPIAGRLITERLLKMVGATGVSLSLIMDGYLDCLAESGVPAKVPGSSLASHSLVATERLKAGEIFESRDSRHDIRLDTGLCERLGVGSLVASPVVQFGQLAGLVEVRWARPNAFEDAGLFACRLMASLVTGILERGQLPDAVVTEPEAGKGVPSSESTKKVTVPESAVEADANKATSEEKSAAPTEKLELIESDVGEKSAAIEPGIPGAVPSAAEISPSTGPEAQDKNVEPTSVPATCRICGQPFRASEAFCGRCSMPRVTSGASENLQSKWASLWFIQQAQGALAENEVRSSPSEAAASSGAASTAVDDVMSSPTQPGPPPGPPQPDNPKEHFSYFEPLTLEEDTESNIEFWERAAAVASASKSALRKVRLKDVILVAVASLLTVGVISAWPSNGKVTWFGSIMVRLGLAQHSVPSYAGNPAVNVWVDGQTSRYYCPGEARYNNTASGRFTTQLEAEQAQLQPASGLVCQ